MYTQTYGLVTPPFSRALKPADVLLTPSLKELQARLDLVVRERGIALVTGESLS